MKNLLITLLILVCVTSCNNDDTPTLDEMCERNKNNLFEKDWRRQHQFDDSIWRFKEDGTMTQGNGEFRWKYQNDDCDIIEMVPLVDTTDSRTLFIEILGEDVLTGKGRIRNGNLFDIKFYLD